VCIDQENDSERTHQVSLMAKIYTQARKVNVYTGEATERTDILFDWLNSLDTQELNIPAPVSLSDLAVGQYVMNPSRASAWANEILTRISRVRASMTSTNRPVVQRPVLSHSELIDIVNEYSSRRWFKRVWVLQEISLPRVDRISVLCGSKTTTADRVLHGLSLIHNDAGSESAWRIFVALRKRIPLALKSHLLDLLIETRGRGATDPRDKIFSLLNIVFGMDNTKFPELEANYGVKTADVYTHFSTFFIKHHGLGFFLSLIKSKSQVMVLPSWVADWTVPWPNYKAVRGKNFPAGCNWVDKDEEPLFEDHSGRSCMVVHQPKIIQGYFTRDGHMDDSETTHIESVEDLADDEVLIEIYSHLAVLMKADGDYYNFIQVCPHALSTDQVSDLVERWSDIVVAGNATEMPRSLDPLPDHLCKRAIFKVR